MVDCELGTMRFSGGRWGQAEYAGRGPGPGGRRPASACSLSSRPGGEHEPLARRPGGPAWAGQCGSGTRKSCGPGRPRRHHVCLPAQVLLTRSRSILSQSKRREVIFRPPLVTRIPACLLSGPIRNPLFPSHFVAVGPFSSRAPPQALTAAGAAGASPSPLSHPGGLSRPQL